MPYFECEGKKAVTRGAELVVAIVWVERWSIHTRVCHLAIKSPYKKTPSESFSEGISLTVVSLLQSNGLRLCRNDLPDVPLGKLLLLKLTLGINPEPAC